MGHLSVSRSNHPITRCDASARRVLQTHPIHQLPSLQRDFFTPFGYWNHTLHGPEGYFWTICFLGTLNR
ncbi:hypothetical protein PITC_028580 [Penicillium italicum]|uniref:Uncharacterized protein n=1 Tax=Penicillium italicum TaxID=40296 RepID=A0A0A2KVW6_PENIT|nr:hypothetical protein PITC_028580 [Penicillium italicum]